MRFIEQPPVYLFFTGKGGVGKTSLACATAVQLADQGRRVLLVSTDPASNVGQVFGLPIGNRVTAIEAVPGLSALEIDPPAAAQAYRERIVGPVRGVLPDAVVKGIEEQLSGACTTEIAAFDEFTSLLTDGKLAEGFDHIVFDTAPTGHTIRLLQLPGAWTSFLQADQGDASCLGPLAGLEKQRSQYEAAVAALADPLRTRLVLVARAQRSALQEAARTHEELAALGLSRQHLVINGILPALQSNQDPLAAAIVARERAAIDALPQSLCDLPQDRVPLKSFNVVGLAALRDLLLPAEDSDAGRVDAPPDLDAPSLAQLVDEIEPDGQGLVIVMGKGGVGKTTVAAAIAVELARRGHDVHLTTSDPAAHLAQTLSGSLDRLTVSRIDPHAETENYRREVLAQKGARLDTAPTGHTLLLLDATGAYHREFARQVGSTGLHFTTPMMQLQDPRRTRVILVTLAETTPVLEAAGLQEDLRRAGIHPWAWIVNNSLAAARPISQLLQRRAMAEIAQIEAVADRYSNRFAVIPMLAEEPVGIERLLRLSAGDISAQTAVGNA